MEYAALRVVKNPARDTDKQLMYLLLPGILQLFANGNYEKDEFFIAPPFPQGEDAERLQAAADSCNIWKKNFYNRIKKPAEP